MAEWTLYYYLHIAIIIVTSHTMGFTCMDINFMPCGREEGRSVDQMWAR